MCVCVCVCVVLQDERNQILTTYLWVRQVWMDAFLAWKKDDYDGLDTIRIPSSYVWRPDIVLYNRWAVLLFVAGEKKSRTDLVKLLERRVRVAVCVVSRDGRSGGVSPTKMKTREADLLTSGKIAAEFFCLFPIPPHSWWMADKTPTPAVCRLTFGIKVRQTLEVFLLPRRSADDEFSSSMETNVVLRHDGQVMWDQPAITKSSCSVDVAFFPFDVQQCHLTFGSWTHNGNQMDLFNALDSADLADFIHNVEWEVRNVAIPRRVRSTLETGGPQTPR